MNQIFKKSIKHSLRLVVRKRVPSKYSRVARNKSRDIRLTSGCLDSKGMFSKRAHCAGDPEWLFARGLYLLCQ